MRAEHHVVELPSPRRKGQLSLEECILRRRSIRSYLRDELSLEEISQLCWSAQGITGLRDPYRAAPSAGATLPLELYLVKSDGLFKYVAQGHRLLMLSGEDLRRKLAEVALAQDVVARVPVDFVITVVWERITGRYGQRGEMYAYEEAGHAAQNIHLQAVALGLGSVPVGAFSDAGVKQVLSLAKGEAPVYIIPVGHPKD
jgi:SagB-type dehydrogenase family enzyme